MHGITQTLLAISRWFLLIFVCCCIFQCVGVALFLFFLFVQIVAGNRRKLFPAPCATYQLAPFLVASENNSDPPPSYLQKKCPKICHTMGVRMGFLQKIWHTDPKMWHTNPLLCHMNRVYWGVGVVFNLLNLSTWEVWAVFQADPDSARWNWRRSRDCSRECSSCWLPTGRASSGALLGILLAIHRGQTRRVSNSRGASRGCLHGGCKS